MSVLFKRRILLVILIAVSSIILTTTIMFLGDPFILHPELRNVKKPTLNFEKVSKLVLAFYYPWYGMPEGPTGFWRHWDEGGHNPDMFVENKRDLGATDYPVNGPYDSKDERIIAWHFKLAEEAGIDGFIVSWWGFETFEDEAFRLMLKVAEEVNTSIKLTVYYEIVHDGRDEAVKDIERILRDYGDREAFLKVQGYPIVFIYSRALHQLGYRDWDYVTRRIRYDGFKVLLIADSFDEQAAEIFDGVHTYNPVGILHEGGSLKDVYVNARIVADKYGVIFSATTLPGYDDTRIRQPGLAYPRRGGDTYRETWKAVYESNADWVLICSWNEWHEGSEIEPSLEYGDLYLNITAEETRRFKGSPG
ncbi:glycoside hydrolase family 99-like domain-containing protein [Candidatus Bathyarchaeota archaeon]|nr:glycoside hydrolase family 99-like domain-containing protein [Candidatus Bathyarchaeota archaeon]